MKEKVEISYEILAVVSDYVDIVKRGHPIELKLPKGRISIIYLEEKGLLTTNPLSITERGYMFMHEFEISLKMKDRMIAKLQELEK